MPYILKGHAPKTEKMPEPVVVPAPKSKRYDLKHPEMDQAILAGYTVQRIMTKFGVTDDQVKGRIRRMRETGALV